MTFDILIKNGTILDGIAPEGRLADIGISGNEIKAIGNLSSAKGAMEIFAEGKYVSPGFVDIQNHSDSYFTLLEIPSQDSLVSQGITTIAIGHCGSSLAPLPHPQALQSIQKWRSISSANINWLSFEEFLGTLARYPLGVNVVNFLGHSTIRRGIIGDAPRIATLEEIKIMAKIIRDSLLGGAAGLSLGLVYAHETDANIEELAELAREVGKASKLLSVHLRSEGGHVVEALNEALDLAKNSRASLKISHFKIRGRENWDYLKEALGALDRAYQQGTDVFFDVYPYTTSWTILYTYLPKWAYEGGRRAILKNLSQPDTRQKIIAHLRGAQANLGNIFVATSETNPAFVGKTLAQIAANQEVSVEEALLNVLLGTQAQVVVFDHNLSEEILFELLRHPLSVVATDGAGYDFKYFSTQGLVHPRCFGAMPKFLSLVRDRKIMRWGEAIRKLTSRPAEKLKLRKRGLLEQGYFADVVVFDPKTVGSAATYENPYLGAEGIDVVIVNGKICYNNEGMQKSAGRILKV